MFPSLPNPWRNRRRGQQRSRNRHGRILSVEPLETRQLLTVIVPAGFTESASDPPFVPFAAKQNETISVPTLRDAIIEANFLKGTDTIVLEPGTYELTIPNAGTHESRSAAGDLNITGNLTIRGAATDEGLAATTIRQMATDRVFEINSANLKVSFQNLIITGGKAVDDGSDVAPNTTAAQGGGIWASRDKLSLSNVTLQNNAAAPTGAALEALGGGLYASGGSLSLTRASFAGNTVQGSSSISGGVQPGSGEGGALYASGPSITMTGCTFTGNMARGGDGGNGTEFDESGGNGGKGRGGGMYAQRAKIILGAGNDFSGNEAVGGSGGAGHAGDADAWVGDGGYAGSGIGGGLYIAESTITTRGVSSFHGNKAQGGVGGRGGDDSSEDAFGGWGGDGGAGLGGGFFADRSTIKLASTSLSDNQALGGAGGPGGSSSVNGTDACGGVGGQGGEASGGGMYVTKSGQSSANRAGSVVLTRVTCTANLAEGGRGGNGGQNGSNGGGGGAGGEGRGGGLYADFALLTFLGIQVNNNTAQGGDGGLGYANATIAGNGGAGGDARGGGVSVCHAGTAKSRAVMSGSSISGNRAVGGNLMGGGGLITEAPAAGNGYGGGLELGIEDIGFANILVKSTSISNNTAQGGDDRVTTSVGGHVPGNGYGGGITLGPTNVTVQNSDIGHNRAVAGMALSGEAGDAAAGAYWPADPATWNWKFSLVKTNVHDNVKVIGPAITTDNT